MTLRADLLGILMLRWLVAVVAFPTPKIGA